MYRAQFENSIGVFMDPIEASKRHPCVKKAWIEFLDEKPDPAVDRVEEIRD